MIIVYLLNKPVYLSCDEVQVQRKALYYPPPHPKKTNNKWVRIQFICVFQVLLAPSVAWVQERIPCGGHRHAGLWRVWPASPSRQLSLRLPRYWCQGHCGVFRWGGELFFPSLASQITRLNPISTVPCVKNKVVYGSQTVASLRAFTMVWQTNSDSLWLNMGQGADTEPSQGPQPAC